MSKHGKTVFTPVKPIPSRPLCVGEILDRVRPDLPSDEKLRLLHSFYRMANQHSTKTSGNMMAHVLGGQLLNLVIDRSITTLTTEEKLEISGYLIDNITCQFAEVMSALDQITEKSYVWAKATTDEERLAAKGPLDTAMKQLSKEFAKIGFVAAGFWTEEASPEVSKQ